MNPVEATDTYLAGYIPTDYLVGLEDYFRLFPDKKPSEQTKRLMEWADRVGNPVICLYRKVGSWTRWNGCRQKYCTITYWCRKTARSGGGDYRNLPKVYGGLVIK